MTSLLTPIAILLYLASATLIGRRMALGIAARDSSKTPALILGLVAVAIHTVTLKQAIFPEAGLTLGFFNMLSLVAWLMAALVLISAINTRVENLGLLALPLAALALALKLLNGATPAPLESLAQGLQLHILFSIVAYSLLGIAVVQALLLAVQNRQLRNRHPGGFIRALPPLESMERLLFLYIGVGYLLLSLALVTGVPYIEDIFAQHLVHKTVLSVAAWVVFAVLLYGRWHFGWRGRKAVRWTLAGFGVLLLAYFGSTLVKELILGR